MLVLAGHVLHTFNLFVVSLPESMYPIFIGLSLVCLLTMQAASSRITARYQSVTAHRMSIINMKFFAPILFAIALSSVGLNTLQTGLFVVSVGALLWAVTASTISTVRAFDEIEEAGPQVDNKDNPLEQVPASRVLTQTHLSTLC